MHRSTNRFSAPPFCDPVCPWQHVGLSPGFLDLIEQQGSLWARERELAEEVLGLLDDLTGGCHELLRQIVYEAVEAGFCSPGEALGLAIATAPDDKAVSASVALGGRAWIEAATHGCGAVAHDAPDQECRIAFWPLQPSFPSDSPPPDWVAWERLAIHAEVATAARKVLGWLFRRGFPRPASSSGRGAKP